MRIDLNRFPYKEMRSIQQTVLEKLKNADKKYKYFILELPTGSGKSAIAKTICSSYKNGFLITATKQLQDQYYNDFRDGSVKAIKGKVNYKCDFNNKLNCEIGPCLVNKDLLKDCKRDNTCPYYKARNEALYANTALMSYQYALRGWECGCFWKPRDILILDECHLLESQITQWAGFTLYPRELHTQYDIFNDVPADQFIILSAPPEESGYKNNTIWLKSIWDLILKRRLALFNEIKDDLDGKNPDTLDEIELDELASTHKDYYELDKLYKRFQIFFEAQDKEQWLIEPEEDGLSIQPINMGNLFKKYVDKWATDKVIFMSATILDIKGFCEEMGLPKDQTAIIKMEPEFDPQKSPIVYFPVGPMNYKNIDNTIPKIIDAVKIILKNHPNEKGIIHTSNYKVANAIYENINDSRLLIKNDKESNESLLNRHTLSKEPTVLLSPSLTTGADLKDDLSRFQIAVKLPWASLADKRVKKKIEFNSEWYMCEMFKSFLQACGRSTRSERDYSITYVLDNSFYSWTYKYRNWFSKQFLKRIIWKKDDFNIIDFYKKMKLNTRD